MGEGTDDLRAAYSGPRKTKISCLYFCPPINPTGRRQSPAQECDHVKGNPSFQYFGESPLLKGPRVAGFSVYETILARGMRLVGSEDVRGLCRRPEAAGDGTGCRGERPGSGPGDALRQGTTSAF